MIKEVNRAVSSSPDNLSIFYEAGPFWQKALDDIEREFLLNGIRNFRGSDLNLNFFVPTYGCPGNGFTATQKENLIKKCSNLSKKQKAHVKNSLNGFNHALSDYGTFYASNFKYDPYNLLSFSESKIGNPVEHFHFNNKNYSRSSLNYLLGLSFLQQQVPDFIPSRVLEIGGGFGTLGEILTKCNIPDLKYIDLDLSPMFIIASEYAKKVFGDREIFETGTYTDEKLEIDELCKLNFLPNWSIETLKGKIDLFVNFISFQEMEPNIVGNYASHVQKLEPEFLLLRNLREGKQKSIKGRLGVNQPILGDDYLEFFDQYKLKASNTVPFGFQTVDGYNSEIMLLEKK